MHTAPRSIANASLTVVTPVFNKATSLPDFVKTIIEVLNGCGCKKFEILAIDDGSNDQSLNIIKEFQGQRLPIRWISFGRNFGKEAALSAGLDATNSDLVVVIDADLEHPPQLIPQMLAVWQNSSALIVSARKSTPRRQNVARAAGSSLFNRIFSALAGFDFLGASDFKLLDRAFVDFYKALDERHRFFRGLVEWSGLPRAFVEFEQTTVTKQRSSFSFLRLIRYSLDNITSFSAAPLYFSAVAGLILSVLGGAMGAWAIVQYFSGRALTGFATVILLQVIFSGAVLLAVGTVAIYLAKINDEIKRRPIYVVSAAGEATDAKDSADGA